MRSSSKINPDFLVVGVAALIITLCSVLLYADFTMKGEATGGEQIGTITFKRRVAQRKYAAQVIWEDLDQKTPVYNNDSIRTSDLSEAVINLDDGTAISLDENSLILLSISRDGVDIDFTQGTISASRAAVAGEEATTITIKSGTSVVSIEKADVRLSTSGEATLDVAVTEGTAEIQTGSSSRTIGDDERLIVTGEDEARVVKRSLKPLSPQPLANYATAEGAVPVDFRWEPVEGRGPVYLEIARDRDFSRMMSVRPSASGSLTERLGEGEYFWRIRRTDQADRSVEYSDARRVSVMRDAPVRLLSPGKNEAVTYGSIPPVIEFRWQENRFANEYRVDISRDPGFKSMARSFVTPLREVSVDRLDEGTYYWRVTPLNAAFASYGKTGGESFFRIIRTAEAAPPVLTFPPDRYRAGEGVPGGGKDFMFSWSANDQPDEYIFMIARDTEFRDVVEKTSLKKNHYAMRDILPPADYHWRVGLVPKGGGDVVFSPPRFLTVLPSVRVTPGLPTVKKVRESKDGEIRAVVGFSWSVEGFSGDRRLELARDGGFLDMTASLTTSGNGADVRDVLPGTYYWRVRLIGRDRTPMGGSDARPLYLSTAGAIVGSADEIIPMKTAAEIAAEKAELRKMERARAKEEELARMREAEAARKSEGEAKAAREKELARTREAEAARKREEEARAAREKELARTREAEAVRKQADKEGTPVLEIVSSVRGGRIYINSKLKGYGSLTLSPAPGTRLLVEVKAERYVDFSETVTLSAGEKRRIDARLASTVPYYREKKPGRRLRWRTRLASTVMSKPLYQNNMIIVATQNGQLAGISMNGRVMWRTGLGSDTRSTPAADGQSLYIVTVKGDLVSLNVKTGRINWKRKVSGPLLFGARPVIESGRVFIATSYGVVQAFSNDGNELWQMNLEEGVFSSMAVEKGVLFVGTDRSKIYAINADSGDVKWTFATDSRIFTSSPTLRNGTLFVGCYSGSFYALNAKNGRLRWVFKAKKAILSPPAFMGDIVFVGSEDGVLHALAIGSGEMAWEFTTRSPIVAGPDVSKNTVLVPSGAFIYSLDTKSGDLNWKEGLTSDVNTTVTVVGDAAYVGLENGEIVSFSSL